MAAAADRRVRIADAVITVLGEQGSRALTHRAVDRQADLPPGSTSYYFRTRADLLNAAVPRLAELDLALLDHEDQPLAKLTHVLEQSLTGPGRLRTLARYELALEAARRPELRRALGAGTQRMLETLVELFPSSTLTEARSRSRDLLAFIDGLLLANVTNPESQPPTTRELTDLLSKMIDRTSSPMQ